MPLVVGAEAAGEIAAVGDGVTGFKPGDPVVMYGALTCGTCKACREGRDNLCENVAGIMGFHVDGFARDLVNMPARLVIPVPKGVAMRDAACAPIAFSTVEHMLFDNAKLQPGETILVQAGGSGIGTVAIKMAKAIGCTVITTVGDDDKADKAKALGADHVINYRTERFETITRKLTNKKGVDVVFEHVGGEGFNGSLLVLEARRTAGHLRLDRGADHHLQPDAAVPAAVQDFRLVRRLDAQHPRQPRQDGERPPPRDRHRDSASPILSAASRGWKAARCSARSWSSSRRRPMARGRLRHGSWLRRTGDAAFGFLAVQQCARIRLINADIMANVGGALMRRIGPWLPEHRIGRANLAAAFPEKSSAEIEKILRGVWDNLGRVGAEFAHIDRLWDYDPSRQRPGRILDSDATETIALRLRDDGKPALIFTAHLANWELAAVAAHAYGMDSTVLYRRPNVAAIADAVIGMRAGCMGTLIPTSTGGAAATCSTRCSAARMSPCWSINIRCRACR